MDISYNKEALSKLSDTELKRIYNTKTTPTLRQVAKVIGRVSLLDENLAKATPKKSTKK